MAEYREVYLDWKAEVDRALAARFMAEAPYGTLYEAMRYSLLAGGKRLRPVLCMAFAQAVGGQPMAALPAGEALEMVHTYSLIHDDLPCMDNDDYRRGALTNHKVFGENVATLAGDALLTEAFSVLSTLELAPARALRCVLILARAAGADGMVGGQILDLAGEKKPLGEEENRRMCALKTGALLSAACQIGAVVGGGGNQQIAAAERFGQHLGLAFQIRDDMLDVIGTQAELGKPVGSDAENGKSTFVTLLGLENCQRQVEWETDAALFELRGGDFRYTTFLDALTQDLVLRMK